jgi:hypothetical protein
MSLSTTRAVDSCVNPPSNATLDQHAVSVTGLLQKLRRRDKRTSYQNTRSL